MLQPVTHSWTRAIPTGLGFNPRAYHRSQHIRGVNGLGFNAGTTTFQITQQAVGAGTAAATAGITLASALSATTISAAAVATGIGAAVVAAVAIGILIYDAFEGCGATCTESTAIANQVATLLGNNLTSYINQPVHYYSVQQAALNTFNQAWSLLLQNCGNSALGVAGQNCISQRQQGGCFWKTSPSGWQQDASGNWTYVGSGPNGSGNTCWNWFVGYHDPIANDPTVVADPPGLSVVTNADGSVSVTLPTASVTVGADGSVLSSTSTDTESTAETATPTTASPVSTTAQTGDASGLATSPLLPLLLIGGAALLLGVMD